MRGILLRPLLSIVALFALSSAHAFTISSVTIQHSGDILVISLVDLAFDSFSDSLLGGSLSAEICADGEGNTGPCPTSNSGPNFEGYANITDDLTAPVAGSYASYQVTGSQSGSVAGSVIGGDSSSDANFFQDLDFTVDQAVNFTFTGSLDAGTGSCDGIASVSMSSNFMTNVSASCGDGLQLLNNSGVLAAGTYSLDMDVFLEGSDFTEDYGNTDFTLTLTAVPVPAAVWLFGSALCLLVWTKRRTV